YDIRPDKRAELLRSDVRWREIAELSAYADVIVNCVLTPADAHDVVAGTGGVAAHARPGTIFLEMTTLGPHHANAHAALLGRRGIHYLDSPASGGADGAQRGELVLMVGGDTRILDSIRSALACYARHIFHVGEVGAGSRMKAIVQSVFLSQMAAFLE